MADMSFDVVYVGAGNKNLVNACYATKYGGLSVGMFEDRHEAGGGWSCEESPAPGFVANHCSHLHGLVYHTLLFEDFPEIDQMVKRICIPLGQATVFDDGTWLGRYSREYDPTQEKTAKLIARFSERDAERYLWLWDKFVKYWESAWLEVSWNPPKVGGSWMPWICLPSTRTAALTQPGSL